MRMIQLRYSNNETYPNNSLWEEEGTSGHTGNLITDSTVSMAHSLSIYAPPGTVFLFDSTGANKIVIGGLGIYQLNSLKTGLTYLAVSQTSLNAITAANGGIIIIDLVNESEEEGGEK